MFESHSHIQMSILSSLICKGKYFLSLWLSHKGLISHNLNNISLSILKFSKKEVFNLCPQSQKPESIHWIPVHIFQYFRKFKDFQLHLTKISLLSICCFGGEDPYLIIAFR